MATTIGGKATSLRVMFEYLHKKTPPVIN